MSRAVRSVAIIEIPTTVNAARRDDATATKVEGRRLPSLEELANWDTTLSLVGAV